MTALGDNLNEINPNIFLPTGAFSLTHLHSVQTRLTGYRRVDVKECIYPLQALEISQASIHHFPLQ